MAKKKNVYGKESIQELKAEINSIVEYLETIDPEEITDDIDWVVNQKGVMPKIIVTKEEILKTALITIKDCFSMLLVIVDLEGVSPYIEQQLTVLRDKLNQVRDYYKKRPVSSVEHRRLTHDVKGKGTKSNPAGTTRTLSFLVATKQRQIADRSMITKRVLETLPLLEQLEAATETVEFKGDAVIPPAFILLGLA